jgi:arsenate reductase-like glutaredoxin family protein
MKKGCFITAVIVFTILLGAALYIFQNHFDTLILNPGKKLLAGFVKDELDKKLVVVADSPEKTELKKIISDFSKNTEALKKLEEKDVNKLIATIESAMSDSIIQKSELEEISLIIKPK